MNPSYTELPYLGNPSYLRLLGGTEKSIEIGLFDLDFLVSARKLNIMAAMSTHSASYFAVYEYAKLVQRIFFLSDPTNSRRRQKWLPDTFSDYMQDLHNIDSLVDTLIGYGHTGFEFNTPVKLKKYYLLAILDKQTNRLVAGTVLIAKLMDHIPIEMFGVVTDPFYMNSGAGSLLVLSALAFAPTIVSVAFPSDLVPKTTILSRTTLQLEVAKNSFPFLEFIDRFVFYAKNGFSHAVGSLNIIRRDDVLSVLDLKTLEFLSKYLSSQKSDTDVIQTPEGRIKLADWNANARVSVPTTSIYFRTKFIGEYKFSAIRKSIYQLVDKIKPIVFWPPPKIQMGFVSHSGYIKEKDLKGLVTFKVPENMEILIMNSPGYMISTLVFEDNWNANAKYFRTVPITLMKKLFPSFKTTAISGKNLVSLQSKQKFIHSTSGGILLKVNTPRAPTQTVQLHAYEPGDLCPDLLLSALIGKNTTDFAAATFGLFDVSFPTHYTDLQVTNNKNELDDLGEGLFSKTAEYMQMLDFVQLKWPKKSLRISPTKENVVSLGSDKKVIEYEMTMQNLVKFIQMQHPGQRVRLCIFSCGNIDDSTDSFIHSSLGDRTNHVLNIELDEYKKYIGRVGEAIFDIYNQDLTQFSPATPLMRSRIPQQKPQPMLIESPVRSVGRTRKSGKPMSIESARSRPPTRRSRPSKFVPMNVESPKRSIKQMSIESLRSAPIAPMEED